MLDSDQKEFGRLLARVEQLEEQTAEMRADIKTLLALANQSKGGFWVGMSIAGALGSVLTFVAERMFLK